MPDADLPRTSIRTSGRARARGHLKTALALAPSGARGDGATLLIYHRVGGGTGDELDMPVTAFARQLDRLPGETLADCALAHVSARVWQSIFMPRYTGFVWIAVCNEDASRAHLDRTAPVWELPGSEKLCFAPIRAFPKDLLLLHTASGKDAAAAAAQNLPA